MAGAITFNVLVAVVPLILLIVGISGFVISARFQDPTAELLAVLLNYLPAVEGDLELVRNVGGVVERVVGDRAGFSLLGAAILAWIATRLVATLRVVLRHIFEPEKDRGIVTGKLFDLQVVVLGGILLILNVGVSIFLQGMQAAGVFVFDPEPWVAALTRWMVVPLVAFLSAWVLFYLLYRYVPARMVHGRTAAIGATFTATIHELMKAGFTWYVTSLANFTNAYGNLAVVAVLFFWIYYSSVVFIVGGYVARSFEVRREFRMKRDKERSAGSSAGGVVSALVVLIFALSVPAGAGAQTLAPFGGNGNGGANGGGGGLLNPGESVVFADRSLEREMRIDQPLVDHDGAYVVVHIAESRVFVMEGRDVVWSAPAGTGHGFQLEGQGQEWTFTTPVGMFSVLRKEKDPVWIVPDWWYVQRDIRIPPRNDPSRYMSGTLGTSALFLGDGIAIHGTDRPELLMNDDPEARRVSHGCIRLTDEAARQLYHLVDVGTPVLIY